VAVGDIRAELIDAVDGLHRAIDENARALVEHHRDRMQCRRGCHGCCSDGLTVFEVEAAAIVRKHGALLAEQAPHPEGRCAFLDAEGGCRIYEERPYVCRTQGLPIRWIEEDRELRDICTLNVVGQGVESARWKRASRPSNPSPTAATSAACPCALCSSRSTDRQGEKRLTPNAPEN
jgi:hypothetical protein